MLKGGENVKKANILILLLFVIISFVGCKGAENNSIVLLHTNTLKIEAEGKQTHIFDLVADKEYNFITKRVMKKKSKAEAITNNSNSVCNTDTLKIDIAYNVIIVNDKTANKTYYIKGGA